MTKLSSPDNLREDRGLETLLDLDGTVMEVGGFHRVRIRAIRVPATADRPHGIDYSLCLFAPDGKRPVCFDNVHPVRIGSGPARRRSAVRDHFHKGAAVAPYPYRDAATLLADFWDEVDKWLRERGIE